MKIADLPGLLKATWDEFNADRAPRLGAALAYYTVFSLAPLLIVAIAIAGFFFGQEAARGELLGQARGRIGQQGAEAIQGLIENANQRRTGIIATVIGIVTLLFGASGVFGELQGSLNAIWGVEPRPDRGIWGIIQDRFLSLTLVLGTGFLLLVSLILSSVLSALSTGFQGMLPGSEAIWQVVNFLISFGITTLLFGAIYKLIPDAQVAWRDVWIGAIVTSLLFSLGRFLIGLYLGSSSTTSVYGAAGSFVVILIWVYYSAQILFLGAEFTQVYANSYGSKIEPASNAIDVGKWSPTAAAKNAVEQEREVGVVSSPVMATESQPAGAQPHLRDDTPAGTPDPSSEAAPPKSGLLVPFSFAVGLLIGLYRRMQGRR